MGFRFSPLATGVLVASLVVLVSSHVWATYYELGPSRDEWGLKYDGEVTATADGKLNVSFTLSDPGRLKPIHSIHVFALTPPTADGSRTYLLKTPIASKPNADGKLSGTVQIDRKLLDLSAVRIFTFTVDGRTQRSGAWYYDIPLRKLVKRAPATVPQPPTSTASPPALKVAK